MILRTELRVGVLVDSYRIPCWAYNMLDRIQHGNYAKILLIARNGAYGTTSEPLLKRIRTYRHRLLYNVLSYLDHHVLNYLEHHTRKPDPNPFDMKDVRALLPDVTCITLTPTQESSSDSFTSSDVDKIKLHSLDVIIKLGFGKLTGKILNSSRHGVWSYHHGDDQINHGGPPGFWEVLQGWPVTGSTLQILSDDLNVGLVLYRSYSQTDSVFVGRNNRNVYWKSLSFLPRTLERLYNVGEEEFFHKIRDENQHPRFYSRPLYSAPTNLRLLVLAARHYSKYLFERVCGLFRFEQWILLYSFNQNGKLSSSLWQFKKLIPPKDRFWADPFVVHQNGKYYIYFEEFLYESNKAHISCLILDKDGNQSTPVKVIEQPYHLSYPFVFLHQGSYYMVPESAHNRTIDLYQCIEFPDKWRFVRTLMHDVCAVDASVLNANGKWWLFANIRENDGASTFDELFLFYASDLFSERWTPHPNNPIISDVRSARPAGAVFSYNGSYYRPSQDNSVRYGKGMNINQIVVLSESEYREICVSRIDPLWDDTLVGTHTLNHDAGLTVIDGCMKRSRYFG